MVNLEIPRQKFTYSSPKGHSSGRLQRLLKGHTISSSISLIFCTVVMIVRRNTAENKAALFDHFPFLHSLLCCSNDEDGDTVTLSLALTLN